MLKCCVEELKVSLRSGFCCRSCATLDIDDKVKLHSDREVKASSFTWQSVLECF